MNAFSSTPRPGPTCVGIVLALVRSKASLAKSCLIISAMNFPALVNEVQNLANETRKALEALGPSRQTSTDQRQYLTRSAVEYQRDVSNVLNGVYPPKLQKGSPRKLRTRVRSLIDEFASRMAKEGHRRAFKLVNGEDGPEYTGNECFGLDEKDDIEDWIRTSYHESRAPSTRGCWKTFSVSKAPTGRTLQWITSVVSSKRFLPTTEVR